MSGPHAPGGPASFVGRRDELSGVRGLLSESRLVTLTGVGGVGKTRLARQVAAEVRRAFPDGVRFVDVPAAVAAGRAWEPDALAEPAERGEHRRALLVLDGCESRLAGCAELVGGLLRACPWQRVLATSRQPLDVGGEVTFPVPSLPPQESVALFAARAGAGAEPDDATADVVAEICRRLDGLPLAIELAAAQVGELTPAQVLAALTDPATGRATLLDGGAGRRAGAPPRHETLRACVDWSYDLCSAAERTLWARLSVFEGGFELAAVEAVCGGGSLPDGDLLDLVTSLVTKSVLVRGDEAPVVRYRMPAVVHEYGRDRLRDSGEEDAYRGRHRDRYLRFALAGRADWPGPRQEECLARLVRDVADLRAAVETCLAEAGGARGALELLTALPVAFWQVRGLLPECRRRLEAALDRETAPTRLRARALGVAGQVAFGLGDDDAAQRWGHAARVLALRTGAVPELARATHVLGLAALAAGDLIDAVALQRRGLEILAMAPDADPDPELRLTLLNATATAASLAGDREAAAAWRDAVLAVTGQPGDLYHRARSLTACALAAWRRHDPDDAVRQASESLHLVRRLGAGDSWDLATLRLDLEVVAWAATRRQRHRRAATLLAAAGALGGEAHEAGAVLRHLGTEHGRSMRRAGEALGDDAYEAACRRGRGLGPEEAIELALGPDQDHREPAAGGPPPPSAEVPMPLTRREQQVAGLVAGGQSNREIAATLVISQRTAEAHVGNILTKLGFGSRAQIAAWAAGRHLVD